MPACSDPEDLVAPSRGIGWSLNHAKDAIGESEAMRCPPDTATATMAACASIYAVLKES